MPHALGTPIGETVGVLSVFSIHSALTKFRQSDYMRARSEAVRQSRDPTEDRIFHAKMNDEEDDACPPSMTRKRVRSSRWMS